MGRNTMIERKTYLIFEKLLSIHMQRKDVINDGHHRSTSSADERTAVMKIKEAKYRPVSNKINRMD